MSDDTEMTTDILVIGSGPGGCVSATEFAAAGHAVLMVEEGEHLSLASTPHFSPDEMLRKYRNAGVNVALGKHKLAWVEGCCVGGGSEINRGLYHRAPDYILKSWARDFGVEAIGSDFMRPHFEACEAIAKVEYVPGDIAESSLRMERGARAKGWHVKEAARLYRYDANGGKGEKQSMSATFVTRFLNFGGRLMPSTRIARLQRRGGYWYAHGTRKDEHGTTHGVEIRAGTIFVACGAVNTPSLLRRSGVCYNIGNSLRFHPMLKLVAEFDEDVNKSDDFDPVHQIKEFEPRFGMGCSISKPSLLAMALSSRPDRRAIVGDEWHRMGIYYVQTIGGVATVRNLPRFTSPLVRVRFGPKELATQAEGFRHLCEAMFAAGAVRILPCIEGYPDLNSPDDVRTLPLTPSFSDGSLTSVHVFSSCPMGEDIHRTATNSFGKVHGIDGLYVSDASLLCTPTVANPQGTVMAVSHRNAIDALERHFS